MNTTKQKIIYSEENMVIKLFLNVYNKIKKTQIESKKQQEETCLFPRNMKI